MLAEEESPTAMMSGFELIAAVWAAVDRLAHAYTTGEGLAWHEHDPRLFGGVARFYGTSTATRCSPSGCPRWTA